MTSDPLSRLEAYADQPDVYDAPTPEECRAAAKEIRRLRKQVAEWEALYDRLAEKADSMAVSFGAMLTKLEAMKKEQE